VRDPGERKIAMSISAVSSFQSGVSGFGAVDPTRQKSPQVGAASTELEQIRDQGLSAWARDQKMEALRAKIRAQVLSDNKLSEQGLDSLPAEQKGSVEQEIARLIEQKLQGAIEQSVQDAARTGQTQGVFLNIMA
jgi:hypothetical protein